MLPLALVGSSDFRAIPEKQSEDDKHDRRHDGRRHPKIPPLPHRCREFVSWQVAWQAPSKHLSELAQEAHLGSLAATFSESL